MLPPGRFDNVRQNARYPRESALSNAAAKAICLAVIMATIAATACGRNVPSKVTAAPSASGVATAGSAVRLAGINVEPSYRPWRYLAGPNPDGWWCVQPNCTQNPDPTVTINAELTLAHSLGVGNLRLEFPWTFLEPQTKGTYDWSRADTIVSAAQSHGVQLQPIIVFTPAWSQSSPMVAPNAQDFYDFVHALVIRYRSSIHIWEMWNEPDLVNYYWNSGEQTYVTNILVAGFNAVKAADPSAKVVIGAPSTASSSWLNNIYTMGGANSFDIMAYHSYGQFPLADGGTIQSVLDAHGQSSKPIWLGEYGTQDASISDTNQQSLMTTTLTQSGHVAVAQSYNLRDDYTMGCCPPSIIKSQFFGLVLRDDVTQKNGFATVQGIIGTPPAALVATAAQSSAGGLTVNFTGTAIGGSSPYWYYWDFGDGTSSIQLSSSHAYLGAGSYSATFTVVDAVGRGSSSTVLLTVGGAPGGAAVLPAVANAAYGGYTTTTQVQNVGTAPAAVSILYFDSNGVAVGSGDSVANLPMNATWSVRQDNGHSFAPGGAGSARVSSTQPIATFVNEFAPYGADATSYTGISPGSGAAASLFAPAIVNNGYGGYTTGIGLVNLASTPTNLTITYRDSTGSSVKTQTLNAVAAGAYQGLYSGDSALGLPNGFAGTATITSSAGNVAAVVNETGPGGQFSSYDAVPAGSSTLYAPAALKNAYGGYNTGMGIQNTTGTGGTVTITYYDTTGAATVKTFPIVANGYVGVYQGTDIPVAGAYTATLTSTVAIAAIVNEVAPSLTSAKQSTAYNTFAVGSSSLHLPLVESAGADGWSTGEGIMNTGTAATMVTVTYYDTASGAQVGTAQSLSVQPNAYWGLYQPTGGLPTGTRASAVVTTATGGQVAVICNESSSTSFMSYGGQ